MTAKTKTRTRSRSSCRRPASLPYEIRRGETGAGAHVVVASGELDLHAARFMRETLGALAAAGRIHLVIDMSGATFIDSAMIGVLAAHMRQTRAEGGSLALVASNENVLRTLEIAGVDRELQILAELSDPVLQKVAALPRPHQHSKLVAAPATQLLRLPPDPSELALARGFAVAAARRAGFDPRRQYNLAVATNEAVANAIQHGTPCPSGSIDLWVDEAADALTVGVRNGGDFVLEPLPPDPLRDRGRGLRLMSQMVDRISIDRESSLTVVRLVLFR
jgi:anti-anti-sigma factor